MTAPAPRLGRTFIGVTLYVGASVILAGCTPAKAVEEPKRLRDSIEVIDGNTFRDKVSGQVVRISNIDAPEMPGQARCWAEARLAIEARDALVRKFQWDLSNDLSVVQDGPERDQYGRLLGRAVLKGEDLGDHLISLGLAAPATGQGWNWCAPTSADPNGAAILQHRFAPTYASKSD